MTTPHEINRETLRRVQVVNRLHELTRHYSADEIEELNEGIVTGRWRDDDRKPAMIEAVEPDDAMIEAGQCCDAEAIFTAMIRSAIEGE